MKPLIEWTPEKLAEATQRVAEADIRMWIDMGTQLLVCYGEIPLEFTEAMEAILARRYPPPSEN